MKYIRTKDGIHRVLDTYEMKYVIGYTEDGFEISVYKENVISQSDDLDDLCDCFIIKFVESNTFSGYSTYEEARYVYEHDKQNTTCILYGVIENENETALKYVAIETFNGLTYIED